MVPGKRIHAEQISRKWKIEVLFKKSEILSNGIIEILEQQQQMIAKIQLSNALPCKTENKKG